MSRQLRELRRAKGPLIGTTLFALVAILLTSMVAGTLSRAQGGEVIEVHAVFSDATGLRAGDDVRMSGVRIGRVAETTVGTGEQKGRALVTIRLDAAQPLHEDVVASIDYLNLMGQRYVAITRPDQAAEAGPLEDGATIPIDRTRPALDLSAMFNAFKPVFDLLQPEDVNQLATNIVQVLQGQGGTLEHLLDQTTELTSGMVDRDETLAQVVDNVNLVLTTTTEHRTEITSMVDGLDDLTRGLAEDRDRIGTSLDSIARLSGTTADLLDEVGPEVTEVTDLSQPWLRWMAGQTDTLAAMGTGLPQQLKVYLRSLGYGSYLNVYVCSLGAAVTGIPGHLDLGVPGAGNSKRCQ